MSRNNGFLKGTIIGAVVGSVAALLLAPKSGKETQADIKRKARIVKDDINKMLDDLQKDLSSKIDNYKEVAKDLRGEARVESEDLVRRAELLKSDLRASATGLSKMGTQVKDSAVADARRLIDEGGAVISELERVTRKMVSTAKDRVRNNSGNGGESVIEEDER
jgi:gas vesicle protein